MKDYLIYGGLALLAWWLLMSRRLTPEQARRDSGARFRRGLISVIVAGGCVWFAYWVLSSHCGGGC